MEAIIETLQCFTPSTASDGNQYCDDENALCFQCLDIIHYDQEPTPTAESFLSRTCAYPKWGFEEETEEPPPPWKQKTKISIFGCDNEGLTIHVIVNDFSPFFFVQVPLHWSREEIDHLLNKASTYRKASYRWEKASLKHRLYGFIPSPSDPNLPREFQVIKLSFETVWAMKRMAKQLNDVLKSRNIQHCDDDPTRDVLICEEDVSIVSKFLDETRKNGLETGLRPCSWVKITKPQYMKASNSATERKSHCAIELECSMYQLTGLPDIEETPPYVVAATDIECFSDSNEFPDAENTHDTVICIGTTLERIGFGATTRVKVVQFLGPTSRSCDDDNDNSFHLLEYKTEKDLLNAWRDLIVFSSVNIITGYNLHGFDYEYLSTRAVLVNADRFFYLGNFVNQPSVMDKRELTSSAMGQNDMCHLEMPGRVTLDMFNWIKGRFKLDKYSLNFVSEHFLEMKKNDLPYKTMNTNFREQNPKLNTEIAMYCSQDCNLPLDLLLKLQTVTELSALSSITMTCLSQIVSRGQQIRVYTQIMLEAHAMGYVMNHAPVRVDGEDESKFIGATVIEPLPGFYEMPIATLDFNSLYPSIMQAHNLCYSTFVNPNNNGHIDIKGEYGTHEISSDVKHVFMTKHKGVLSRILENLLSARASVRAQMKKTSCEQHKALLNGRQLAFKVSANSVYGFTGAKLRGKYPLVAIAESTTCQGRNMIDKTKLEVERRGYRVVYGDTDSVMIDFGIRKDDPLALQIAFQKGEQLATEITSLFPGQIVLEFEKAYFPWILIAKKRYVGLMYTNINTYDKIDAKGIELVRRDTSPFTKKVLQEIIDKIMFERDIEAAKNVLQKYLLQICEGEFDFEDFILSKALRKDYVSNNLPHLEVVRKIRDRKGDVPQSGDRVPFVIIDTHDRTDKVWQRAEDPAFVLQHGLNLDLQYYVTNHIQNPVCSLFKAFEKDPGSLFESTLDTLARLRGGTKRISTYCDQGQEGVSRSNDNKTSSLYSMISNDAIKRRGSRSFPSSFSMKNHPTKDKGSEKASRKKRKVMMLSGKSHDVPPPVRCIFDLF